MEAAIAGSLLAVWENCSRTAALQVGDGSRSTHTRRRHLCGRVADVLCKRSPADFVGQCGVRWKQPLPDHCQLFWRTPAERPHFKSATVRDRPRAAVRWQADLLAGSLGYAAVGADRTRAMNRRTRRFSVSSAGLAPTDATASRTGYRVLSASSRNRRYSPSGGRGGGRGLTGSDRDRGRSSLIGPLPHHPACGSAPGGSSS
jgi:hypothetical protein